VCQKKYIYIYLLLLYCFVLVDSSIFSPLLILNMNKYIDLEVQMVTVLVSPCTSGIAPLKIGRTNSDSSRGAMTACLHNPMMNKKKREVLLLLPQQQQQQQLEFQRINTITRGCMGTLPSKFFHSTLSSVKRPRCCWKTHLLIFCCLRAHSGELLTAANSQLAGKIERRVEEEGVELCMLPGVQMCLAVLEDERDSKRKRVLRRLATLDIPVYPFNHQNQATLGPVSTWIGDRPNNKYAGCC
jgi:hypothetical protein